MSKSQIDPQGMGLAGCQDAQKRLELITENMPLWMAQKTWGWAPQLRTSEEAKVAMQAVLDIHEKDMAQPTRSFGDRALDASQAVVVRLLDNPEWMSFAMVGQMQHCGYTWAGVRGSQQVLGEVWRDHPGRAQEFIQSIDCLPRKAADVWLNVAIAGLLYAEHNGKGPAIGNVHTLCHQAISGLVNRCSPMAVRQKIVGARWREVVDPVALALLDQMALEKTTPRATPHRPGGRL